MTTFVDFRFSRTLASALFSGDEQEEIDIVLEPGREHHLALELAVGSGPAELARFFDERGESVAVLERTEARTLRISDRQHATLVETTSAPNGTTILGLRVGTLASGLKVNDTCTESAGSVFRAHDGEEAGSLRFECSDGVRVMGRGTGRALRWGQLFYTRREPTGPCVELTMDWHHLRAGIPLFSTMTAEELVAQGRFRLRFRSYAYRDDEAEATDFVRLFSSGDTADIAVHMTPSLYMPDSPGLPNMAFAVGETGSVHPHLVDKCNRMDRICVPTRYVRDAFVDSGVKRPVDVVMHGVDVEFYSPSESSHSLPGGRGFNFLAVGTHVERKNIKHLVRAFLEEFGGHEDVALFLLLRPEYHTSQNNVVLDFTEWEREWDRNSAPIMLWTGYLSREHLRDFYAHADAYVMPSNEGFGLTLLEAMACGTPAIGLDHGGVVDFLNEENGILVPTSDRYVAEDIDTIPYVGEEFYAPDIHRLRKAMRRMFEDRELVRRLGVRARADAESLTWAAVSGDFSDCIERTLDACRRRRQANNRIDRKPTLTVALCVTDDTDARRSLNDLRHMLGNRIQVLCLFTRYARIRDVTLARSHGFINYRWDGTLKNCLSISRAIFGPNWVLVLHNGEQVSGDLQSVPGYIEALPQDVSELSIEVGPGQKESRLFLASPQSSQSVKLGYSGLSIKRS